MLLWRQLLLVHTTTINLDHVIVSWTSLVYTLIGKKQLSWIKKFLQVCNYLSILASICFFLLKQFPRIDHWGLQTPWIRGRGLHVQEQKILRPETGSFRYQGHDETRESGPTQRQDGVCPYTYPRYTQGRLLKATFMSSFIFAGKHEIIKTKSNSNVLGSFDFCVTSTCNL